MIRFITLAGVCVAAAALFTPIASAQTQQVCFSNSLPLQNTNWNGNLVIPKFDAGLGTLTQIDFTLTGNIQGSAAVESLDTSATVVQLTFAATLTLTRPDLSVIVVTVPLANFFDTLQPFDGTIDFGGASGATHPGINATASNSATSPPPASDLVLFTGPAGNPGTISLPITAVGSSTANGSGNVITQFMTAASADVQVCYTYLPNVPPVFQPPTPQCGSTLMASAGVPLSFTVCAGDVDGTDTVTLTGTLPAGATTVPALPASGNPVCVTVNWTPTAGQLGTSTFTFVATDTHQRTASCQIHVLVAECYQFIGRGGTGSVVNLGGVQWGTFLGAVRFTFPVTMIDRPSIKIPNLASGQLQFSMQTLMHNPDAFPLNPDQWSQRLRVTVLPGQMVLGDLFQTLNGIHQGLSTFTDPIGDRYVTFPFTIDGM
jgi:Big-like domain-containing protein